MDNAKFEVTVIQETLAKAQDNQTRELSDLELALIGGGIADPIVY